jgi:parallel beta-helix repeat protein
MKKLFISQILVAIFILSIFSTTINAGFALNTKNNNTPIIDKRDTLPSSFSWRDIDGVDFTTGMRDQSPYPSCETFAITAAVEAMVQIKVGFPFDCDLSEAHLFFWSGGNIDWGSYPENDTKFLVEHGMPDEACWPYPKGTPKKQYPLNTTSPDWKDRTVKIKSWSYLPEDPIAIKEAIVNNGPVPTYFHVYEDFPSHKGGIYRHRWGASRGPHYVCLVGYNDDPGYWIVKNSWGKKVNDEGWFKIAYGECEIEKKSFLIEDVYGVFPLLYVDDDNTAGPWDGSKDYPFNNIQEAIDAAYPEFGIYVKNGTYKENVVVNKTIRLIGENSSNTIIDGNFTNHVVQVSTFNVIISGFTIKNSSNGEFDAGIKTLSLDSYVTITDNIIENNQIGIYLNYAYEDSNNIVTDNLIQNNVQGIYSHWSNSNKIENNIIQDNDRDGIEFIRSQNGNIIKNVIKENGGNGIYLRGSSDNNQIKNNIIENNSRGIFISESHQNFINKNYLIKNGEQAYFKNSFLNKWRRNYGSDWKRIIPRMIKGAIYIEGIRIPWRNIDFFPLKTPNEAL